jgi:stress response protein SCP2
MTYNLHEGQHIKLLKTNLRLESIKVDFDWNTYQYGSIQDFSLNSVVFLDEE